MTKSQCPVLDKTMKLSGKEDAIFEMATNGASVSEIYAELLKAKKWLKKLEKRGFKSLSSADIAQFCRNHVWERTSGGPSELTLLIWEGHNKFGMSTDELKDYVEDKTGKHLTVNAINGAIGSYKHNFLNREPEITQQKQKKVAQPKSSKTKSAKIEESTATVHTSVVQNVDVLKLAKGLRLIADAFDGGPDA